MLSGKHLLILLAVPAIASAQSVRGTAVDPAGAPVPGVVVLLVNERDSVASRSLTNESGDFRVAAAVAGSYRLRTMRIGFRPTTSPAMTLGTGQEITQRLVLAGVPFSLDTIRVAGRNACRTPTDSAAAVFAIWEQARTALTATQLTAGARAIGATIVMYQRMLDPDRERVVSQHSTISSGHSKGVWISPSAETLRRDGYVVSNLDGTTTYFAPDLNVLLSTAFIEDHCFRLATARDPSLVGIAFEPTRERRGVAGIRGTLWLDRKSSELRRMEFRYTNATREQQFGNAGGHMEFASAKNGAWVISSWNIRTPVLEQVQVRTGGASVGTTPEIRVRQIRVEGGELALVTRNRDTLWARAPLALAGRVLDSLSGAAIAAAHVALRGTALQSRTDSAGRFRIADVLPGEYTVEIRSPSLAAIGAVHTVPLMFTDSATALILRVPTATQMAASVCPGTRDGMIAGMVRLRGDSVPSRNVKVVAEWNETTTSGRRFGGLESRSDGRGAFRLCGVPLGTDVTLRAQTDSAAAQPVGVRIPVSERFASVELILDRDVAQRVGASLAGFVLSDVNGEPIADVEVAIPALPKNVFTNDRGAFRLSDIPPGRHLVTVRRVGYAVRSDSMTFAANQVVDRTVLLKRVAMLDTIAVAEPALRDFEERRRLGLGKFLTRADIEKLHGRPIASTLSQLGGAGIELGTRGQAWILTSRPRTTAEGFWCPHVSDSADRKEIGEGVRCGCYAQVYLDRTLLNPPVMQRNTAGRGKISITRPTPPFDVNSIPSDMMEAVEWYAGPAQTPPEFGSYGGSCGVLVIHTRRSK